MWWIISLLLIPPLLVNALVATFFVIVMLNGYPSLPDAMVNIYLVSAIGLIPGLSLLAGLMAHRLSEASAMPLAVSGLLTGAAAVVVLPITLVALTFALLAAFGML